MTDATLQEIACCTEVARLQISTNQAAFNRRTPLAESTRVEEVALHTVGTRSRGLTKQTTVHQSRAESAGRQDQQTPTVASTADHTRRAAATVGQSRAAQRTAASVDEVPNSAEPTRGTRRVTL